jgi:hypothetical protein
MRLLAPLLLLLSFPASAWMTVEEPPQATLEWVAKDMVYNGVPTRIQFFRSKAAPQDVLAYYRQRWTENGQRRYVENRPGPWKSISRAVGDFFVTVQVRRAADGGAEGYLSQRPLKTPPTPALGQGFALPQGSSVVNDIQSRDGDQQARTLLAFNSLTVDGNAAFFRSSLADEGWGVVSDAAARNGGRQLVLRRGSDELSIAMTARRSGTAVGATLVRH